MPSSSALWKMSVHFPLDLQLFHWSFELSPASSTEDDRQRDLDVRSFEDHPACLWVMALFSTAMCFSTLETGLRLGEAEEGDGDTRNIALEKGVSRLSGIR